VVVFDHWTLLEKQVLSRHWHSHASPPAHCQSSAYLCWIPNSRFYPGSKHSSRILMQPVDFTIFEVPVQNSDTITNTTIDSHLIATPTGRLHINSRRTASSPSAPGSAEPFNDSAFKAPACAGGTLGSLDEATASSDLLFVMYIQQRPQHQHNDGESRHFNNQISPQQQGPLLPFRKVVQRRKRHRL